MFVSDGLNEVSVSTTVWLVNVVSVRTSVVEGSLSVIMSRADCVSVAVICSMIVVLGIVVKLTSKAVARSLCVEVARAVPAGRVVSIDDMAVP